MHSILTISVDWSWWRCWGRGAIYNNVKPLIMHLVEMEDGAFAAWRKETLDGGETVLGVGAVFDDAVEI
jgi:hypothetical protein